MFWLIVIIPPLHASPRLAARPTVAPPDFNGWLCRYVTPLTEHMEELVSHRKYRPDLEREPIETDLARQKGEDPKLIPYAFSPHPKFPAYAILSYMPKVDKPAIKEYVKVRY